LAANAPLSRLHGFELMWPQVRAIAWAQWRIARNHLPRTSVGSWLMLLLGFLWYCAFAAIALTIAKLLSVVEPFWIRQWLPAAILGVCTFWQVVPLITLTGGWSLDVKKLQSFPFPTGALFGIETFLRITTAFEMVLIVLGAAAGLALNPGVPTPAFLFLLLLIPFNLLLSLGVREFILHSFARNRMREMFALLVVSIAVLPQILLRTPLGVTLKPYVIALSRRRVFPWSEIALLSTGRYSASSVLSCLVWIGAAYLFARTMFARGLREDNSTGSSSVALPASKSQTMLESLAGVPGRLFRDPLGILIEKEIRSLLRMPRFRVILGMACFFSVLVFLPMANRDASFMRHNFPDIAALYGMLILSDALFWNFFGFDRAAAQIYFAGPVDLRRVIQAKNLTSALFVVLQNTVVLAVAAALRLVTRPITALTSLGCTAVVTIFFIAAGNISSVTNARAVDPSQTLKKQTSAQRQLWLLCSSLAMCVLVGLGMLARWAVGTDWAMISVLAVEFGIGVIVFRISLDTAVLRGSERRETIVDGLSGRSPDYGSGKKLLQLDS
jgi:ABC-2 type transport system permease protein